MKMIYLLDSCMLSHVSYSVKFETQVSQQTAWSWRRLKYLCAIFLAVVIEYSVIRQGFVLRL